MLEARGLCKTYRVGRRSLPVVQGVDLTVEPGSFVTILGRSGSGKSTLLALLGGLARPSAGRVELLGQDLSRCSAARRGAQVGTMFQQTGLLPTLTALENALLPARLAGLERRAQAVEWLTQLGLGARLWALPGELSGGEQRRVAAVRAVIHRPRLVLADEPTGDLDPDSERLLLEFLRQHASTLILVTHQPELARGCQQLFRMEQGVLRPQQAPPERERPPLTVETVAVGEAQRPGQRLSGLWLAGLTLLLALLLVGDLVTDYRQRQATQARQLARQVLQRAAMFHLRGDVAEIKRGPGGSYRVQLFVDNPFPDQPIYLMPPEVSAYVQVGFQWIEVPLRAVAAPATQKVVGRRLYEYIFKPQIAHFEEVLPGYMHVRLSDVMRLSLQEHPDRDGVTRRSDNYFVYLQPPGADPVKLAKANHFPGKAPLWIAMPPH